MGQLLFAPWAWAYSTLHPLGVGYSWEGIRQVRATLLGARHVPERLCGSYVYLGRYIKCSTFTFLQLQAQQLLVQVTFLVQIFKMQTCFETPGLQCSYLQLYTADSE